MLFASAVVASCVHALFSMERSCLGNCSFGGLSYMLAWPIDAHCTVFWGIYYCRHSTFQALDITLHQYRRERSYFLALLASNLRGYVELRTCMDIKCQHYSNPRRMASFCQQNRTHRCHCCYKIVHAVPFSSSLDAEMHPQMNGLHNRAYHR